MANTVPADHGETSLEPVRGAPEQGQEDLRCLQRVGWQEAEEDDPRRLGQMGSQREPPEVAVERQEHATRDGGPRENGYIRRPFLLDGLLKGLAGGALALLLTWGANELVSRYVLRTDFFDLRVVLLGLLAGALLGTIGSLMSVGRHLRQI